MSYNPILNNEKVTISFAPATQADEDALNSLLPEGEITDESQLPSSIPLYINVKPQLKLNGKVIQELEATTLGSEYTLKQTLYKPTQTLHFGTPRLLIAGGYYGVNTIVQSISVEKLKQLQAKIKQTQETLQNSNQTQINSLTREDIMGDMVYASSLSYYAQMIAQGKMAVRALDTHYELVGSSGIIGYKPQVEKLFGLPIRLKAGGMNCDLIDTEMTEQSNNNQTKHVQANQQLGIIGSSLEHQVLEQLFAQNGEQAFSAVKAIQLANEQGQKIYTITKENYQEVLPKLQLAQHAITDIRNAAQAGLTITTHEKRITINGYTGEGYIILNEIGGGAYLINGGLYGGILANGVGNRSMFINSILGRSGYYENVKNVLVGFTMFIAGQTQGAYLEFGKLWDLSTVKLKKGAADIIQLVITMSTIQASIFIGSKNNMFIFWYYYGKGDAIDLKEWKLGEKFENGGNVPSLADSFINEQISKLRTAGRCEESYMYSDTAVSDVTWEYQLFSIGSSTFFRKATCSGGICNFTFHIEDEFTDPLDGRKWGDKKPFDLPGASKYDINYSFERTKSCF